MAANKYIRKLVRIIEKNKEAQKELLKLLSDPGIKKRYGKILELLRPFLKLFAKLLKLSTREIEALVALIEFVIVLSLFLKKNILDNPEARKVISEAAGKGAAKLNALYATVSEFINRNLNKLRKQNA